MVVYFSATGRTRRKAKRLAAEKGAELFELRPKEPYSLADLNWMSKKSRSSVEMNDPDSRPELTGEKPELQDCDTVYLGFPIWWYTAPHIINTFLESNDLSGKDIVLFATSGGSSIEQALADLRRMYPELSFRKA